MTPEKSDSADPADREERTNWPSTLADVKIPVVEKEFVVYHSFADAERADRFYYHSLTPSERLDILLELIARGQNDETAKGFERVYRIAKLHET